MTISMRALAIGALGLVLATPPLHSQGRSRYRDFQLGGDLGSISALTGVAVSNARTIHLRPAIMQELQDRTAGMTDADLIEAISTEYGPQSKPGPRTGRGAASQVEEESGTSLARWAGDDYSVVLYRSYSSNFRIIVASPRLEALARTADVQAVRLDDREAPLRELARHKKETEDLRASQEKARLANKAAFRP
jgi:hypothetical protein